MLVIIIPAGLIALALILILIRLFTIGTDTKFQYSKDGDSKMSFRRVEFANDEEKEQVKKELQQRYFDIYFAANPNNLKPEDIQDTYIFSMDVPCKKVVTKHIKFCKDFSFERQCASYVMIILACITFLFDGVGAIICYSPLMVNKQKLEYQSTYDALETKEQVLYNTLSGITENNIDNTASAYIVYDMGSIAANINEYNDEVTSFKQTLYTEEIHSRSLWLGVFVNPAYRSVTGYTKNAKSYRDILGDNLKVFIPKTTA